MQKIISYLKYPFSNRFLPIFLFFCGFIIRIYCSFFNGDGDMEHFKAWSKLVHENELIRMYSKSDLILKNQKTITIREAFNKNRVYVEYKPSNYWRTRYMIMYPPISILPIYLSSKLYYNYLYKVQIKGIDNFSINIFNVLLSIILYILIYSLLVKYSIISLKHLLFGYWLNPIFLIDSPIQGYNNIWVYLFLFLIFFFIFKNKLNIVFILLSLLFWTKPQGALIFPIVLLSYYNSRDYFVIIFKAISIFILISFFVLYIPIQEGYLMSYILGSTSALTSLQDWSIPVLSARSWNFWWLFGFLRGNFSNNIISLTSFQKYFGFKASLISYAIYFTCLMFTFFKLKNHLLKFNAKVILVFTALVCYNTIILNVQYNQFIIIIPFLLYFTLYDTKIRKFTFPLLFFYFAQIIFNGGFGRDFVIPIDFLQSNGLIVYFNIIIIIATIISIYLIFLLHRKLITTLSVKPL
jgi:hypothetical protein